MGVTPGRLARALLLAGGIVAALALPSLVGTPLIPANGDPGARIAMAAPAWDNDNNGDPTDDDSDERNIEGQIVTLYEKGAVLPAELAGMPGGDGWALVGMVGGDVWARVYDDQLRKSGARVGDYVKMQGEYVAHGIFDAYQVNVVDDGNGNDDDGDNND